MFSWRLPCVEEGNYLGPSPPVCTYTYVSTFSRAVRLGLCRRWLSAPGTCKALCICVARRGFFFFFSCGPVIDNWSNQPPPGGETRNLQLLAGIFPRGLRAADYFFLSRVLRMGH